MNDEVSKCLKTKKITEKYRKYDMKKWDIVKLTVFDIHGDDVRIYNIFVFVWQLKSRNRMCNRISWHHFQLKNSFGFQFQSLQTIIIL